MLLLLNLILIELLLRMKMVHLLVETYLLEMSKKKIQEEWDARLAELDEIIGVAKEADWLYEKFDDGKGNRKDFHLNHPWEGLFVPTGIWRTLEDFSSGAVCLVLASEFFDEADYLYEYDEFLEYVK